MRLPRLYAVVAAALVVFPLLSFQSPGHVSALASQYSIVVVDAPPNGDAAQPLDVNDIGHASGTVHVSNNTHAFVWKNGTTIDLGVYPEIINRLNNASGSPALNNTDHVLVSVNDRTFIWHDGVMQDLLGADDPRVTQVVDINDTGQVLGMIWDTSSQEAFLWHDGEVTILETSSGWRWLDPMAVNDHGQVVGTAYDEGGIGHAVVWDKGVVHDLGTLSGFERSEGWSINNLGQVVGRLWREGYTYAFLWDATNGMRLLYSSGTRSDAYRINDRGQILAQYQAEGEVSYTDALWENGVSTPLVDLLPVDSGWSNLMSFGLSNKGHISGLGELDGELHGFVMTPGDTGSPGIDLTVTDLKVLTGGVDTSVVCAGSSVDVAITISNTSMNDSGAFTFVVTDGVTHEVNEVASLIAGASLTEMSVVTAPPTAGSMEITVEIDPDGLVAESNEINNELTRTITVEACEPPVTAYYFALGDSIAAGHGLDNDSMDPCRWSTNGYPDRVWEGLWGDYDLVVDRTDLACSGATAAFNAREVGKSPRKWLGNQVNEVEAAVRDLPDDTPILVSITIGANDFEFSNPWTYDWLYRASDRDFKREIQRRSVLAQSGLVSAIRELLQAHPNTTIVLTELYNPFNERSVFFHTFNRVGPSCAKCGSRVENTVTQWNESIRSIASQYDGNVIVTEGLQDAFDLHRSPGGTTTRGNVSKAGGGCGFSPPGPGETWIQYRNDPNSFSDAIPWALGLVFGSSIRDPDGFSLFDGWSGDCFHPNASGAEAIAGFVLDAFKKASQ